MDTAVEKMDAKVAQELRRMEARIDERLRTPEIECYLGEKTDKVRLVNTGDKESDDIELALYTKEKVYRPSGRIDWEEDISDEEEFRFALRIHPLTDYGGYVKVKPRDSGTIELPETCSRIPETDALLKVYYGEPRPEIFRFIIKPSQER